MCCLAQVLEATPYKAAAVRPLTSYLKNHSSKMNKTCGTLLEKQDELMSDVLQWNTTCGRASVGRLARNYLHQICADTGCSLEDLPGAMDDRDGWRVRESHGDSCCQRDLMMMMKFCLVLKQGWMYGTLSDDRNHQKWSLASHSALWETQESEDGAILSSIFFQFNIHTLMMLRINIKANSPTE